MERSVSAFDLVPNPLKASTDFAVGGEEGGVY